MGKIIAVANQKGGVGKTTTAVNLAAALGQLGKRVLLIDADPQGNATSSFGVDKKQPITLYEILLEGAKAADGVLQTHYQNLWLIPSGIGLAAATFELSEQQDRLGGLKKALSPLAAEYDFIIIDCPPELGLITVNVLTACHTVLIPIQPEFFALEGLSQLMATIRKVKNGSNPQIDIEGVLFTMYDGRLNLTVQVAEEVKKFFSRKVYQTAISRNVRLSEAPSFGMPCVYYDPASKGAQAYMALANEVLQQNKGI